MTVDPQLDMFLAQFRARVADRAIGEVEDTDDVAPLRFREQAFTEVMLEFLEDYGHISDADPCYLERRFGRGIGKFNAWQVDTENGVLTVATTIFRGLGEPRIISAADQVLQIERAARAIESALQGAYREMEPATCGFDAFELIYSRRNEIDRINVVVLADGYAADLGAHRFDVGNRELVVDVWDLRRCYRVDSSGLPYEPIEIDLSKRMGRGLPILSLSRTPTRDFEVLLAIFPGELLYELYHEFGPRILELNVRSFLQARGKVNRGIRDTLRSEPEYFIAYNNGISATAEAIEVESTEDGPVLTKIRGLQIVNGGQTVASIHRAKVRDGHKLQDVYVQAKITQVKPDQIDYLVPKISRYANTQNSVGEADFSANHPFHVRMQQLSQTVWTPGEQSKWFYERARGQYEVAMQREGNTVARRRRFEETNPKRQKVDKVSLAKYVNAWEQMPHIVSRGGQKNFSAFMQRLGQRTNKEWEPDAAYFKNVVAQAILFKHAEKVARAHKFPGYRANTIAYTVALLAFRTAGRISLQSIWDRQALSGAVANAIHNWMPEIFKELIESAGNKNVTEWCKQEACWRHMQTLGLNLAPELIAELEEGQALPTVGSSSGRSGEGLTTEDRENIARVMQIPSRTWVEIVGWGAQTGNLTSWQQGIATTLAAYAAANWNNVPSKKQALQGVRILGEAEKSGGLPFDD